MTDPSNHKPTQRDYLLHKFRQAGGSLTTFDLITDIHTAAEYRKHLSHIRRDSRYEVLTEKLKPGLFRYTVRPARPAVRFEGPQGLLEGVC